MIELATERDGEGILAVASRVDIFTDEEKDTVRELWEESCKWGVEASGYQFIVARQGDRVLGFACYGPRPLTDGTYDLYWIAVDPSARRQGVGVALLKGIQDEVRRSGGRLIVIETSGQERYAPTRAFYLSAGCEREAVIRDFYGKGDDLILFTIHL